MIGSNPTNIWWWNRHSFGNAWNLSRGAGIKVGVIDDGFETTNTDGISWDWNNRQSFWCDYFGFNAQNSDVSWQSGVCDPADTDKVHGTQTASFIGAKDSNGIGLCGGAPDSTILPMKIGINASGLVISGNDPISIAIEWAINHGCKVINISMSYSGMENPEYNTNFRFAATDAWFAGVSVVVAAGNHQANISQDGWVYTGAIMVGATDHNNYRADFSNYGTRVDIAAAGVEITGDSHNNGAFAVRTPLSGTSFAAPLVAAAAALVRKYTSDSQDVRDILIGTADWAWGNDRRMDSNLPGSDGINKVRVLNADAAVCVAARPSSLDTVYMPASDNYAEVDYPGGSVWGWHPVNLIASFAPGTQISTWTWNSGGPWAGATSVFKGHRLTSYQVTGACYQVKATGDQFHTTYGNGDQTYGWVNGWSWNLP